MLINNYHNIALDHTLNFTKNYTPSLILFYHFLKPDENIIVYDQYKVPHRLVGTNSSLLVHCTNYNVNYTHDKQVYLLMDNDLNYLNFQDLFGCIIIGHKSYYIIYDLNYFSTDQYNFKEGVDYSLAIALFEDLQKFKRKEAFLVLEFVILKISLRTRLYYRKK